MSLINKDLSRTEWPKEPVWIDEKPKNDSIIIRLAVAIVLTLAIATVYAVSASPAVESVTSATYDNLMSDVWSHSQCCMGMGGNTKKQICNKAN